MRVNFKPHYKSISYLPGVDQDPTSLRLIRMLESNEKKTLLEESWNPILLDDLHTLLNYADMSGMAGSGCMDS